MHHTTLRTTQLGHTGLKITRVGFGAWAIGGGNWEFSWGPQDDDESIAAIHRALEQGVIGSTPPPPTASAARSRSSAARLKASPSDRTCSPSAHCSKGPTARSLTA
jgi:hypothetical protein